MQRKRRQMHSLKSMGWWGVLMAIFIAELLAEYKLREEDLLAAEGYQFYAQEAEEFARVSQQAVMEAWGNDR